MYKGILGDNLKSLAEQLGLKDDFVFPHDNDLNDIYKLVLSFLTEEAIKILKCPSQSRDINPIEHLLEELDR